MPYLVLAYYRFVTLENPQDLIKKHKLFFKDRDVSGRIYISEQGINGQMSGKEPDATAYQEWLKSDPHFASLTFKIHESQENIFPRMTVKYRKQLVALDEEVDITQTGTYISPKQWRETLESDEKYLLIDVRNHYETEIGHFENAVCPPLEQFREFPSYVDKLKESVDPETKVLMCCTGGIRCELFSALMKKKGFKNVQQLEGGIINYGLQEGSKHWKGKLFVFDDRMAIAMGEEKPEAISTCRHCSSLADMHYNCSNMECNELFLCCPTCHEKYRATCSEACSQSSSMRPYDPTRGNKPFRRKHLVFSSESSNQA